MIVIPAVVIACAEDSENRQSPHIEDYPPYKWFSQTIPNSEEPIYCFSNGLSIWCTKDD